MPIASGGRCSRLPELRFSTSSTITATTPMTAPCSIIGQSRLPPSTPCAMVEMIAACGAASAFAFAPGAPWKVKAVFSRSRIGGMTSAPKMTPRTSATCCRHGVASTSCAGLQVLKVIVGDRRDAEDDRGHEQGEGDERLGLVAAGAAERARPGSAKCRGPTGCRRPRSGCSTRRSGRPCSRTPPRSRRRRSGCR